MISWDYCTFVVAAANDAQTIWVNTACGKEHRQKKLSKLILHCNVHNQIASVVWETDNPIHKQAHDGQAANGVTVLINVLIRTNFEHLCFTK